MYTDEMDDLNDFTPLDKFGITSKELEGIREESTNVLLNLLKEGKTHCVLLSDPDKFPENPGAKTHPGYPGSVLKCSQCHTKIEKQCYAMTKETAKSLGYGPYHNEVHCVECHKDNMKKNRQCLYCQMYSTAWPITEKQKHKKHKK